MTAGSSSAAAIPGDTSPGTIPVAVAPPGSRMLTLTGVPARSAAMIRESASTPAPAGPYGTNPRRVIVRVLIEMLMIRPAPAASIRGATARATRNNPVIFVSITSRKPPAGTSQNACGSVRNRGFTVRIPIPALLTDPGARVDKRLGHRQPQTARRPRQQNAGAVEPPHRTERNGALTGRTG